VQLKSFLVMIVDSAQAKVMAMVKARLRRTAMVWLEAQQQARQ
jgi:hypothetical protein